MHTPDDLRTVYLVWRFKATSLNGYEVTSYLRHTFMTSSIVSAIIIGCERSFAVRRPLKYRERWTKKLTIKLYLVMYIICMSFVMTRPIVSNIISVEYFKEHLYTPYFIIVRGIRYDFNHKYVLDQWINQKKQTETGNDVRQCGKAEDKNRNIRYQNSYDCYSCLSYLYGSKSYNVWSTSGSSCRWWG